MRKMMLSLLPALLLAQTALAAAGWGHGQAGPGSGADGQAVTVRVYTSEASYMADLVRFGLLGIDEGFEDGNIWGEIRTTSVGGPQTAPSIIALGVTWTSNHPENDVTTSEGATRTGRWGFYSSPHGNFDTGTDCHLPRHCGDGLLGTGAQPMFAAGGWVKTNTPFAGLDILLDGQNIDLGDVQITPQPQFFGVIRSVPFQTFEFLETEGTRDDQKLLFFDDITVGVAEPPAGLVLAVTAPCPGAGTLRVAGATPGGRAALLTSQEVDPWTLPVSPCAGIELGLVFPTLVTLIPIDASGGATAPVTVPATACGRFLQVVDVPSCTPGNLVLVP